jgi:hypothetical protein
VQTDGNSIDRADPVYSYAKFFAEDLGPDCDKVSWRVWIHVGGILARVLFTSLIMIQRAYDMFGAPPYLTFFVRRRMNSLVDKVNAIIVFEILSPVFRILANILPGRSST